MGRANIAATYATGLRRIESRERWRNQQFVRDADARKDINEWLRGRSRKQLVIADLHIPYHSTRALAESIRIGRRQGCDTAILLGDSMNLDAFSRFTKTENASAIEELEILQWAVELLLKAFERVVIVLANHEMRFIRLLQNTNAPNVVEFLEKIGNLEIAKYLTRGHEDAVRCVNEWFYIGDACYSHKEVFSTVPMRSIVQVDEYLQNHWEGKRPSIVVHGHTHHQGSLWHQGRWLAETGTNCEYMSYALTGRPGPSRSELWYQGCVTTEMDWERESAVLSGCKSHFLGICRKE